VAENLDLLEGATLFAGVPRKDLAKLASAVRERSLAAGDTLVAEGQGGIAFFVIAEGKVDVEVAGHTVGSLGPGETFGEVALLDPTDDVRSASVKAATPVRVLAVTAWEFKAFVRQHPDVAWALLQTLARRLRQAEARGHEA